MVATLLLNAGFEPVKVIPWQRAVTLIILGKAELLEAYDDEIRSTSHSMELPSVVRLRRSARGRSQKGVKFCRGNVYRRDEFTCQYCGARPGASRLTFDHVLPRSRGGLTEWTNIVTACTDCNREKADKTPDEAGLRLARPPVRPAYMHAVLAEDAQHDSWKGYLPEAS
ncbi:MAG: HNH endonuclease [Myxococcales bacterium]|nr:HNH endonuclease [Myxococcales bacterium]